MSYEEYRRLLTLEELRGLMNGKDDLQRVAEHGAADAFHPQNGAAYEYVERLMEVRATSSHTSATPFTHLPQRPFTPYLPACGRRSSLRSCARSRRTTRRCSRGSRA